jgi:hypothetical protein
VMSTSARANHRTGRQPTSRRRSSVFPANGDHLYCAGVRDRLGVLDSSDAQGTCAHHGAHSQHLPWRKRPLRHVCAGGRGDHHAPVHPRPLTVGAGHDRSARRVAEQVLDDFCSRTLRGRHIGRVTSSCGLRPEGRRPASTGVRVADYETVDRDLEPATVLTKKPRAEPM